MFFIFLEFRAHGIESLFHHDVSGAFLCFQRLASLSLCFLLYHCSTSLSLNGLLFLFLQFHLALQGFSVLFTLFLCISPGLLDDSLMGSPEFLRLFNTGMTVSRCCVRGNRYTLFCVFQRMYAFSQILETFEHLPGVFVLHQHGFPVRFTSGRSATCLTALHLRSCAFRSLSRCSCFHLCCFICIPSGLLCRCAALCRAHTAFRSRIS